MKFLADESIEAPGIERLRRDGYQVAAVAEDNPGWADPRVLRRATRERRIFITSDKDFAELAFFRRQASAGIILLRLSRFRSLAKARRLAEVLEVSAARLHGVMTVIGPLCNDAGRFRSGTEHAP